MKVQDLVKNEVVEVKYIPGEDQIAGILAKSLSRGVFGEQRKRFYSGGGVTVNDEKSHFYGTALGN